MSHFLRQLKLSLRVSNFNASSRCFSSSPIYYVRGAEPVGDGNKETIRIPSLKVPMELLKDMGIIGASHGWIATMKSGVVCLQDDLDLPDTKPKRIPLPPLVTLPVGPSQHVK